MKSSIIGIVAVALSVVVGVILFLTIPPVLLRADFQIVDHEATYTGGFITQHYAISGRVVNSGSGVSGPVTIGITIIH